MAASLTELGDDVKELEELLRVDSALELLQDVELVEKVAFVVLVLRCREQHVSKPSKRSKAPARTWI